MTEPTALCVCGHPRHHHPAGGECVTIRIFGTTPIKPHPNAELHMGRWQRRCPCQQFTEQPATGEQVEHQETKSEEN